MLVTAETIQNAPELSPQVLERLPSAAFHIVQNILERGDDAMYTHFMWDNFGDPYNLSKHRGPIKIGDVSDNTIRNFDQRFDIGFTDGKLLSLRKASETGAEPQYLKDVIIDDPTRYYLAKADLQAPNWEYTAYWDHYYVIRAEHTRPEYPGVQPYQTNLFLSEMRPEEIDFPKDVISETPPGSIARLLAERALESEVENWWANRPRLTLGAASITLTIPGQGTESVSAMSELARKLDHYGPSIAKLLLQEQAMLVPVPVEYHSEAA
jgi:hypothetical protein